MNLQAAAAVAKQHINALFAAELPSDVRLESFLYDDHLMMWSLTIRFACSGSGDNRWMVKLVRVSEADKSVLSVADA